MKWLNRLIFLWTLPVVLALWTLGWTFIWLGSKARRPQIAIAGNNCLNRLTGEPK